MPHELWLSERFDFSGQKNISLKCGQNNLIHLIKYVGWSAIALSNGNICVNYFSLSLSFSQHTSAQKTVDELGFDQGKGYERNHEENTVPAGFSGQLLLTSLRSLNQK